MLLLLEVTVMSNFTQCSRQVSVLRRSFSSSDNFTKLLQIVSFVRERDFDLHFVF